MNFWKKYINYLKDNPNHYWFKRKVFGWGWTPATREGWLVTLVFIAAVLSLAFRVDENATPKEVVTDLLIPLAVLLILLFVIAYRKGEKPKWMFGFPEDIDKNSTEIEKE